MIGFYLMAILSTFRRGTNHAALWIQAVARIAAAGVLGANSIFDGVSIPGF